MTLLPEAAVDIGLDSFTLSDVAARVGVGASTVHNYVSGRDALYTAAAVGPVVPWLRRALRRGLDELIAAGPLPPEPVVAWRSKLRAVD